MSQHRLNTLMLIALSGLMLLATPARARDIFIAGDSTASVYGPEVFPRMGWGQVLGDFYAEDINVVDLAQSGRSSKSFIDEGFFAVLEKQIGAGDILLIQFGHNDEKEYDPKRYTQAGTSFKTYLKKYIELALEKDATPVLLTPVVRRKFENGVLVPTHGEYPDAMRELAADTGTALIDMTRLSGQFVARLGEKDSKAVYLHSAEPDGPKEDNTHFSETGAYAMASLVARGLDALQLVTYRAVPGQDRPNRWGDRAYYSGAVKQGAPYAWLADNLPTGQPDITPAWTFGDRWDPESRLKRLKVQIALHETGRPFISGE